MNVSRPAVHPVEAPPLTYWHGGGDNDEPRVRMKDLQGLPGTPGGLALRLFQLAFAAISLCVMVTAADFPSVTAFRSSWPSVSLFLAVLSTWFAMIISLDALFIKKKITQSSRSCCTSYLVGTVGLQSLWSLSLAIVDIYALLVRQRLRNPRVVSLFTIGDGIILTLTFASACASAGVMVLIGNDLNQCTVNHFARYESATAMAFMSWFAVFPVFILNFWTLAVSANQ
ncbi:CASP-like protein [Actinidia chinensis var. chinensis]|uniref:CASP-like protein n=1 Tax=Actinidia chinensis var. chinensis TaxID=1590841 RepID=A0A2R6PKH4_ACTCC|nr:CASP-like protein [Actinidia chinensis var. chinensis]